MKRVFLILVILIVFSSTNSAFSQNAESENKSLYYPQDVSISDDAFHGRGNLPFIEWWYFDAIFDNGYSIQLSVSINGIAFGKALVGQRMSLYYNNTLIKRSLKNFIFKNVNASKEIPLVQIKDKTVISGTTNSSGYFDYNISFYFKDSSANLKFIGKTKGWKAQHQSKDWWAVMTPRADVTGIIIFNNTSINVNGTGYHDHNWDAGTFRSYLKFGWLWGKIHSKNYTFVWNTDLLTRNIRQPILVVSKAIGGFYNVPSEVIYFSMDDYKFNHQRFIPQTILIEAATDNISINVSMQVLSIDHQQFLCFVHYWRFHVKCTGTITVDGQTDDVNDIFIAEYGKLH